MVSAPWQEWEGRIIDRKFPLLRYLGGNERSGVFLTRHGEPEPRHAAIKLVCDDSLHLELPARWERAAQLSHPHLIRLLQAGSWKAEQFELLYAVMEYAEEDLAAVLRDRPLTREEASNVLESGLDVLAYLHGQGLAHAGFKPANILAVDNRLKISCDGIRPAGKLPHPSETPGVYDSPEVQNAGFSPAGDIWSLGTTLVEALTQHLPDAADANQKPHLPETLPVEFRDLADSCLQPDPDRRPTAAGLAARLRPSPDDTVEQSPVEPRKVWWNWRYAVPAAALGLAALVAGIGVMQRRPAPPQAASVPSGAAKVQREPEQKSVRPAPEQAAPMGSADRSASTGGAAATAPPATVPPAIAPPAVVQPARPSPKVKSTGNQGVVHQVMPDVPGKARETIQGTVRLSVRAHVDSSGRVTSAELASPGPSRYFAELALRAARRWEFEPTGAPVQDAGSVWLLKFELTRSGTKVHPVRESR